MPSVHIPERAFDILAEEYGYEGAKQRVKQLAREHAGEVNSE